MGKYWLAFDQSTDSAGRKVDWVDDSLQKFSSDGFRFLSKSSSMRMEEKVLEV